MSHDTCFHFFIAEKQSIENNKLTEEPEYNNKMKTDLIENDTNKSTDTLKPGTSFDILIDAHLCHTFQFVMVMDIITDRRTLEYLRNHS